MQARKGELKIKNSAYCTSSPEPSGDMCLSSLALMNSAVFKACSLPVGRDSYGSYSIMRSFAGSFLYALGTLGSSALSQCLTSTII